MKTLGEINRSAFHNATGPTSREDWEAAADAVISEHEARRWTEWPDGTNDDTSEYPPDETLVEIYCGNWASKDRVIGMISKRGGIYSPSGASHWRYLPAPPKEASDASV